MKINKTLIILSLLLIFCISLGAVNAADNAEMSVNDINNDVATIESSVNVDEINVNDGEIHYSSEIYEEIYNATGTYNITHDYQINKTWEIPNPNVIIEGNNHTIYGNGKQAFNITGNNVTIKNLKFVNCSATGDGGAIYWSGNNGVLSGCSFVNCSAVNGGAICFGGSGVSVVNCSFVGCSASDTYGGGAIYFYSFSGSDCNNNNFSDCSFINNTAICGGAISFVSTSDSNNNSWTGCDFINNTAGSGGAIYFYSYSGSSNNVLTGCDFINNTATVYGGAIYFESGPGSNDNNSLSDCSFINNTAKTEYGGAICFKSKSGNCDNNSWTNCSFINNTAETEYGGAICFESESGNCDNNSWTNCSFINNTAETGCGGAICFYSYSKSGSGSCENNGWTGCSFINNTAVGDGGAIYFMSHSDSGSGNCDNNSWSDCSFINNTAETGCGGAISFGGVIVFIGGPFVKCDNNGWTGCDFINNTAEKNGGAIYFKSGSGNCDNDSWTGCSFINNTAAGDGGAIYFIGSSGSVNYCIFENNTANNGGAIYIYSGSVDVDYNFFGFQNNITDFPSGLIKGPTPTHWVVLNISEFGDEYVVKFIDNEGNNLTDVMPDYTASLTFNNKNTKEITIKNNTFKNNLIPGNYKVNSINTGELLALFFNDGFADLNNLIYSKNGTIVLDRDYKFYEEYDNEFINGIVIDKNITIDGNGHTIDGLNLARVFNVTAGTVTFKNINFVNCSGDNGGAIYSSGSLIIEDNVSFINNNATGDGGVIYISSGSLTLNGTNITFKDNVGNDIYLIGSTDNNAHINVVTDCVSTGNSSPSIYLAENSIIDSNTIITVLGNQTITKNKNTDLILNATVSTGGLSVTGGSFNFVIGDKTFNATDDDGDGIFTSTRTFEVPEGTTVVSAQDYTVLNSDDLLTVKTGVIIAEAPTVVYIAITGDGGSDQNQGNFDSPVATIGKALSIVKENGTIIFKDGNFFLNDQVINMNVTITSLNAKTVLQPSSNNRLLNIANGCTVTLSNLTLENGYAKNGGAIYTNGGSIIIGDNMEFINNIATGGGAIYSGNGSVVVSGSNVSFMQNSANVGGAIYSNSSLVVNGSNIKFNTNSNYDIYLDVGSSLNITTNCYSDAPASIYKNNNATIVSEVVITVLDNSTIYYRPGFNCNVTVTATTGNLTIQGITMNLTINGTDNGTYDFNKGIYHKEFTVDFVGVVPIGAKITNVGLPNCKVLNATISSSLNYIIYISTTGNDTTGNGSIDNPVASLEKALEILPINGKIIFKNGIYYPNNVLINKNVNITGDGEVILSGNSTNRILNITGGTVIISNLIFKDGYAENGGAISCVVDKDVQEPLNYVFENCYFEGNTAENYGGALEIEANYVNVINCTFVKNTAKRGAAINIIGSHVNVKYSSVLNNTDSDYGAVYLEGGDINIYNLTLNYNTAKKGAAIYILKVMVQKFLQ